MAVNTAKKLPANITTSKGRPANVPVASTSQNDVIQLSALGRAHQQQTKFVSQLNATDKVEDALLELRSWREYDPAHKGIRCGKCEVCRAISALEAILQA